MQYERGQQRRGQDGDRRASHCRSHGREQGDTRPEKRDELAYCDAAPSHQVEDGEDCRLRYCRTEYPVDEPQALTSVEHVVTPTGG